MALAFGHYSDGQFAAGNLTWAHTCTGDDILLVYTENFAGAYAVTGVTYNGVAMTAVATNVTTAHNANPLSLWVLIAPASGSNNIVVANGVGATILGQAASYSGSNATQFGATVLNADVSVGSNVAPFPITTTNANSWVVMFLHESSAQTISSGSNTTKRGAVAGFPYFAISDSGLIAVAGAQTLNVADSQATGSMAGLLVEVKVAGGGTTTGTGSSSGAGTALAAGAAFASAVGVSAGVGTATGISTASATIALNGIKPYFSGVGQMFPYAAALSGLTNVTVTGTYTGAAPTHVNYRLGGTGSFVGISTEVIGGGNWSGVIPNVAIGDVQLEIQESNNTNVNIDVANVKTTLGLGDIFGIIGDSEGLMPNAGTVTASGVNGHTRWLHPTNGWVDWDITPQFEQAAWAYFGNEVTAKRLAPCFILNGASAGTALANWRHGVSQFDAAVVLFSAANGGLTAIMVPNLGTNDARQGNGLVTATVAAAMAATAADAATYMSATAPLFWPGVAELDTNTGSGNLRAELDTVRKALTATISGSVHWAAFLQDQVYATDGLHPDANDVADIGRRHFLAVTDTLYGTSVGSGPRFVAATIDGTNKIIVVTVDRDLANSISSAVTAFRVYDNGVSVTITSQVVTSLRVITITLPSAIVGTPTLDFASGNDAKGATVPVRAVETLPSGATTQRILQYFSNQTVTPAGTGIGAAAGTGTAFGIGRSTAVAVGSAGGAAIVLGHPPIPFRPLAALTSNRLVGLPESNA